MKNLLRRWLMKLLNIDPSCTTNARLNERLIDIERHFVTKHDPATGQAIETLADRQADKDGRPRPEPLKRSRSWDQTRRFLEARTAVPKPRPRAS